MTTNPKRPGRGKAGESGNPAGRRPGSGEVARLRAAIAEHLPSLIQTLRVGPRARAFVAGCRINARWSSATDCYAIGSLDG